MSTNRTGLESLPEEKDSDPRGNVSDPDDEFGGKEARITLERKLLWKLDLRMSTLVVIYILNYVNSHTEFPFELQIDDEDQKQCWFATLLSILYVGYIIMQIPSNMLYRKPSLYLPGCMIVRGVISALTGITTNFAGALLTRMIFSRFRGSGIFSWYKRDEIGLRTAILYCENIISNAFGALLASEILGGMNGVLGHAAWRWLFYVEGALTCFVAVCAVLILPDFPDSTRWLTEEERRLALRRMEKDVGVGDQDETKTGGRAYGLYLSVTGWEVWLFALALTAQVVALSFTACFPTLSATLGYNPTATLLLVAPPFIFTVILAFWLSRKQERFYHMVSSYAGGIVGFIIATGTMSTAAR